MTSPRDDRPALDPDPEPGAPRAIPNSVASGWIRRIADQWAEAQRDDQNRQERSGASERK